ncbi:MAG: DUF1194 domain-containing protein [Xanthobacteraceae bacterium]
MSKPGPVGNAFSPSLRGSVVQSKKAGFIIAERGAAMRVVKILLALILAAGVLLPASALAGNDVDLLLVLAADVSRSIDAAKFQLQRDGYAAAVSDPRVLDTIKSGHFGRIGLTFVEWSGIGAQHAVIDWTTIGDGASAKEFGDRLLEAPRSFADRTSISGAIEFAMDQFTHTPFTATRRIIDISGDGTNNAGRDVASARDDAVAQGVTINGLVILSENPMSWNPDHTNPPGGLDNYYRNNVIGGPGAFVMVAKDFNSFGQAMIGKLIAEVAENRLPKETRLAAH